MANPKMARGFLPSFNTLDSPSVLSKLIDNDVVEGLTGVVKDNLDNFDEDNPGIFRYYLMNL